MDDGLVFRVLGARGSWPVSDAEMMTYGGRTTSFMIPIAEDLTVIVDAGTGLARVDDMDASIPQTYHVFLTHYHLDHIQGLQFFKPLYREANHFVFHGFAPDGMTIEEAVGGIYRAPWFPVSLEETPSTKEYDLLDGSPIVVDGLRLTTTQLTHPQGCTGYRIDGPRDSIVIATDHEAGDPDTDGRLVEFASGAGHLFHDAQYTPEEHHELYEGWGHSTWRDAVEIARRAGVGRLILTSHDPQRTDDDVTSLVAEAADRFPNTIAAREGLRIDI